MIKNKKPLLIWLLGLTAIFTLLYFAVLAHKGYIFYWDMSGSFDFRAPFDQYFRLFSPWDGENIGVINRLPIVSVIFLIYKPLELLFGLSSENVIKIAVSILFLGAYTVFFYLLPKWFKLLSRKMPPGMQDSTKFQVFRLVFAILYVFVPYYAYRLSQLHIFYMSIFYPVHVYLFIKLLSAKKIDGRTIGYFVVAMFFGLTSPHIIFMNLMTFIPVILIYAIKNRRNIENILIAGKNLLVAMFCVILTNIYWLVPYLFSNISSPGYVINDSMIELLTQGTTIWNFFTGQSDWFVGQANLSILNRSDISMYAFQLLGGLVLYFFALKYLFKKLKREYAVAIGLAMIAVFILIVNEVPYHQEFYESILYTRFGWVFRESNKFYMIWAFWSFLFFCLGFIDTIVNIKTTDFINKLFGYIVLPGILIPYIVNITPINIKFMSFIKPVEIDSSIEEVFEVLSKDDDFFYVYYYPRNEPYRIPWKASRFEISDVVDYTFLPYNSPKPPAYISTVVPHEKSYSAFIAEYLFSNRNVIPDVAEYMAKFGLKYIVVRTEAIPTRFEMEVARKDVIQPAIDYLDANNDFQSVLHNEYYRVYKNLVFDSGLRVYRRTLYSTDTFSIMEHIDPKSLNDTKLVFCNFSDNAKQCLNSEESLEFVRFEDNEFFYLDLMPLEDREMYSISPYDHTTEYGIGVNWGRASFHDKVNAELHNVFRAYGINAWSFDVFDKVVYSDLPYKSDGKISTLSFGEQIKCSSGCNLYAFVLMNHIGGELEVDLGEKEYSIDTKSDFEVYRWVMLDHNVDFRSQTIKVSIKNNEGFNSIGSILIVPDQYVEELSRSIMEDNIVTDIPVDYVADVSVYHNESIDIGRVEYSKAGLPVLEVDGTVAESIKLDIHAYDNSFAVLDNETGRIEFVDDVEIGKGSFSKRLYMVSEKDVLFWAMFTFDVVIMMWVVVITFRKRKF